MKIKFRLYLDEINIKNNPPLKKIVYFITLSLFILAKLHSQSGFQFYGSNDKKQRVKFKLINNLVVIPLEINGAKLQFILDTGVNKTILFNITEKDSIGLNNVHKVMLRGLGSGKPIEALISRGNHFKIKNLIGSNQNLFVILKDEFNLSAKMGTTIHGIIGYDLFKNVIAKINYNSKTIKFYNPKKYKLKKCKKCEVFPLKFYRNKPYINTNIQLDTIGTSQIPVKLLIDSGNSDALWLFEGDKKVIKTPKKHFRDVLGEGLSGIIYGNKSKIPQINFGDFIIKKPTVSFLDSTSSFTARKFKNRNGSIGGNILKRFKVWVDYPNQQLMLKKSGSFKGDFYYNMSGISVIHHGKELVKIEVPSQVVDSYQRDNNNSSRNIVSLIISYHYVFKPIYKIDNVLEGSPADIAGVLKGDMIRSINGRPAYSYTIDEITRLFQTKPNKKIKLVVERLGMRLKFEFRLKERI